MLVLNKTYNPNRPASKGAGSSEDCFIDRLGTGVNADGKIPDKQLLI